MSQATPDRLASVLADRYRIESELGRGGMATVYLAKDLKHRRDVAIKVLKPDIAAAIAHDRFLLEIEIAAQLNHPHIVALFDSGFENDTLYYVMPCIKGESLRAHLNRLKTLPLDEALRLTREIASALAHAHRNGIVHRDIKPENILLADGIAVVADFGIARAMTAAADPEAAGFTQSGLVLGTPHYMSPEQASGDTIDGRSDIYSLACVLFEMLGGRPPFPGTQALTVLAAHIATPAPAITDITPSVPGAVSDTIARALSKNPDDRYATAVRFAEALAASATARYSTTPESLPKVSQSPNNLPHQRTRFIGREKEVEECSDMMRVTRLLTLTGIGGSGKTRLGLAIAQKLLPDFPDGVWLVDLAPLSEAALLPATIASTLRLPETPGKDSLDVVREHLANRKTLLVLDNCEHIIDACAEVADALLASSASLAILATSREGLGVSGERIVAVKPLALPPSGRAVNAAQLSNVESVRLFTDRAVIASPGFALTEANAATIAEICRRLDGIPLAIELAAARTKVLSVEQIRARLDDRFRLLSGTSRGVLPRHQTLTATIQWSYEQLPDDERRLFRFFSIFAGGWTLSAAMGMCEPGADEFAVLDTIGRLVDKSLVIVQSEEVSDETRYGMLETVRQYGRERLIEAGELAEARARHLTTFIGLAEAAYAERNAREDFWAPKLEADHDNLRNALDSARDGGLETHLRLAGALGWFWAARSHYVEGRERLVAALAEPGPSSRDRARALWGMAWIVGWQGDAIGSLRHMREAADMWRSAGDLGEVSLALEGIGWAQTLANEYDAAEATFVECLRIQEERKDPVMINRAKIALAQVKVTLSKVDEARALSREILAFAGARSDMRSEHSGWHYLADCALIEGDCAKSLVLYGKSLELAHAIGDRLETSFEVQGVGMSLAGLGDNRNALRLVGAAKSEWKRIGVDLQIKFWNALLDRYVPTRFLHEGDVPAA
ncbi:MAG: protein kinase domain-containing protein, partial [Gemmatimonadaceae bacterium]